MAFLFDVLLGLAGHEDFRHPIRLPQRLLSYNKLISPIVFSQVDRGQSDIFIPYCG